MRKIKAPVILLVFSFIIVHNTAFSQIDFNMNTRAYGTYMSGKDIKLPVGTSPDKLINKLGGGGAEIGFFVKRDFNIYANAQIVTLIIDDISWFDFWTGGIGLRYFYKPNRKITPYVFGELNLTSIMFSIRKKEYYTFYTNSGQTQKSYSLASYHYDDIGLTGSLGAGCQINLGLRWGFFMQAGYFTGIINDYCITSGFNCKLIRSVN